MTQPSLDELVILARRDRPAPGVLSSVARSLRVPMIAAAPLAVASVPSSAFGAVLSKFGLSRNALLGWGAGSAAVVGGVTAAVALSLPPAELPPSVAITPPGPATPAQERRLVEPSAPAAPVVEPEPTASAPERKATKESAVWDEPRLIERARRALASEPRRALALAQEHQRRFPAGALALEREVILIEALARSGQNAEARRRALAFEARYPKSIHSPRIRALGERLAP